MAIAREQHLALPRRLVGRFDELAGADGQAVLDALWGPDVPAGLRRHVANLSDSGRAIIVSLPPPISIPEAHFAALVREGDRFRLFVLESGENLLDLRACTFFCEWVGDRKVEYGEGPSPEGGEFIAYLESHLDGALDLDTPSRPAVQFPPEPAPSPSSPRVPTVMPRQAPVQKPSWGGVPVAAPAPEASNSWGHERSPDPAGTLRVGARTLIGVAAVFVLVIGAAALWVVTHPPARSGLPTGFAAVAASEAGSPASSTSPSSTSLSSTSSVPIDSLPFARAMVPAAGDSLREEFHKLAESYVALLRSGRPEEAFRYLGKEEQARVTEAEHARWWREAVAATELDNIYVGGIAVDPHGGDVSIVTPSKVLLMRVTGTRTPGIVPFDLSSPIAEVPETAASHWLPLASGARRAFTVDRERTRVISVPGIVGLPEWVDRMTGAIVEEVGAVETTGRVSGIAVRDQRPVPVPDDPRAPEKRTRWMDASETKGVRILAEQLQGAAAVQTHSPPTVLLPPTLKKGQRWPGGFASVGQASLPLTFEVVGLRDVPGESAVVPGCLEVRAVGTRVEKLAGTKDTRQVAIAIRRWYAPGTGLVREVRQEATIDQAAAGAHDERSKITVLSFTARRVEPTLEIIEHPRDLVAKRPATTTTGTGKSKSGSRVPSPQIAAMKERAREEAQRKLFAHDFGEGATEATVQYGVEWVEDDYGRVYDVHPTVGNVEER